MPTACFPEGSPYEFETGSAYLETFGEEKASLVEVSSKAEYFEDGNPNDAIVDTSKTLFSMFQNLESEEFRALKFPVNITSTVKGIADFQYCVTFADSEFACDDSCDMANNGRCDEGQKGAGYDDDLVGCKIGTDMTDCNSYGMPINVCFPDDGVCDSVAKKEGHKPLCEPHTDCWDCGECKNSCETAVDGVCQEDKTILNVFIKGSCPRNSDCYDCGRCNVMDLYMTTTTTTTSKNRSPGNNTCMFAFNGVCDVVYGRCPARTDCDDCSDCPGFVVKEFPHSDTCVVDGVDLAMDGKCDQWKCGFGNDCTDCGNCPDDSCEYAKNGVCEEVDFTCRPQTDCSDCSGFCGPTPAPTPEASTTTTTTTMAGTQKVGDLCWATDISKAQKYCAQNFINTIQPTFGSAFGTKCHFTLAGTDIKDHAVYLEMVCLEDAVITEYAVRQYFKDVPFLIDNGARVLVDVEYGYKSTVDMQNMPVAPLCAMDYVQTRLKLMEDKIEEHRVIAQQKMFNVLERPVTHNDFSRVGPLGLEQKVKKNKRKNPGTVTTTAS